MGSSRRVFFATSNNHKYREACEILGRCGITVDRLPAKGEELQLDSIPDVAEHAGLAAFRDYRRPLLVEDAGLSVAALNGFPGTYSSFVYRTIGLDGVLKLMKGAKNRSAEYTSAAAYVDGGGRAKVFVGTSKGTISTGRRGESGFAYDPIFIPVGHTKTYAQLGAAKSTMSHRYKSLTAFARWYLKQ